MMSNIINKIAGFLFAIGALLSFSGDVEAAVTATKKLPPSDTWLNKVTPGGRQADVIIWNKRNYSVPGHPEWSYYVLLGQRNYEEEAWSDFGGGEEDGSNPSHIDKRTNKPKDDKGHLSVTAAREVWEETGYIFNSDELSKSSKKGLSCDSDPGRHAKCRTFVAYNIRKPEIIPGEHPEHRYYRWVSLDDLIELVIKNPNCNSMGKKGDRTKPDKTAPVTLHYLNANNQSVTDQFEIYGAFLRTIKSTGVRQILEAIRDGNLDSEIK
ncbi:hypothetical protein FACS1894122_06930 [Alphaproteobacteria bacterium]|nr:hypothetical protein FACS1894122_06930 [Alphaproteobacteria bacterium]